MSALRRSALLLALWLVLALPAAAQTAALDVEAIDAAIAEAQAAWAVPGLSVAIVHGGDVVLEKGYGVARLGTDQAVDEHTLYAIASNTKAFTAALLAQLVDEGRLRWDDRVRDHLPYFALYDPYVSDAMTVRDLLSHRSGLGTFSGDLLWFGTGYSAEDVVRRARFVPQAGPFRASYGYSNLMVMAAGEVVRAVTGRPWDEVVQERILTPLAMTRTVTSVAALDGLANVATPHKPTPGAVRPIAWMNWDTMGAAGALVSSAHDMSRWLRLQLAGGTWDGVTLFSPEAQREMWTAHTPIPVSEASRERTPSTHFRAAGLGWFLNDLHGRLVVSHGGGYDGMFSRVTLVPEENLGVVVLTNSMTGIATALSATILDAALAGGPPAGTAEALARDTEARAAFAARIDSVTAARPGGGPMSLAPAAYAGRYGGDLYGDATVAVEDGGLVLRLVPAPALVADLTHLHDDVFRLDWRETFAWFGAGTAQFLLTPAGTVERLRLDVPNDDLWFHELDLEREDA